ncbi:ABC transporter ATP-binding protein [Pedococcus sp. 5OH_020]|uniref:ABC transporter ATP-binding protein n=1 Tax=Pedococcus sp. 5OH_020 TaxID=2989814 RepID=UPI0022E9F17E|nr:ABC transporter ATP-binding protein [Pedococcus sp. 5OH_020]
MTHLQMSGLGKAFGGVRALDSFDLDIAAGEFVSLLGPSGCGKTTALRIVAGFESADRGRVVIDGQDVTRLTPDRRDIGMVFQAYSLFPNMSAAGNVEFGMRLRGVAPRRRRDRAGELLDLVGLAAHGGKYPHQLSGGQQQRVALARALAIEPKILLLDEPLSALDAKVRVNLRGEIRRIQKDLGITTLFVTHDQEEALAISDRVGVMSEGRMEQLDVPATVYREPATPFVAQFVGVTNALLGSIEGSHVVVDGSRVPIQEARSYRQGAKVRLLVRPEEVHLAEADGNEMSAHSAKILATVLTNSFLGPVSRVTVRLDTGEGQLVLADMPSPEGGGFAPGQQVLVELRLRRPMLVER